MTELKKLLLSEQTRLEEISQTTKMRLEGAPEGTLRLSRSHDQIQYYWRTEENGSGTYITKGNLFQGACRASKVYTTGGTYVAPKSRRMESETV